MIGSMLNGLNMLSGAFESGGLHMIYVSLWTKELICWPKSLSWKG